MPSYCDLCERTEPLSKEEGRRIGVDDVILISEVRERMRGPVVAQHGMAFIARVLKQRLSGDYSKIDVKEDMASSTSEVSLYGSWRRATESDSQ
jgi:hypothetical protein